MEGTEKSEPQIEEGAENEGTEAVEEIQTPPESEREGDSEHPQAAASPATEPQEHRVEKKAAPKKRAPAEKFPCGKCGILGGPCIPSVWECMVHHGSHNSRAPSHFMGPYARQKIFKTLQKRARCRLQTRGTIVD